MPARKMHDDEPDIAAALVRRLLAGQFPEWAGLPIKPVESSGTDNALYRLGDDMAVRLPRVPGAADDADRERRWLPVLALTLPVAIPEPLVQGVPAEGFPWRWSVYRWLDGENPVCGELADPLGLARDVAAFVAALHRIDPTGGPQASRGIPLAERDAMTRTAIEDSRGLVDIDAVTAAWEGPPVWLHADLTAGNLLVRDGRLRAVIDFGAMGIGDPACDLLPAWNLLPGEARAAFREELRVDDATWRRGRGWALSIALVALPYYQVRNPVLAEASRYVVDQVLSAEAE